MDMVAAGTTEGAGGKMVFVKVREVYDLHTIQNKMTVIGIHTPKPDIIKANFPGLLMQCKGYRPYSCDVKIACASQQALDPLGVGTTEGAIAPEDLFNPILYKAMSNFGMSQLEARIAGIVNGYYSSGSGDVNGFSASVEVNDVTTTADEFPIYYGLLSNAHGWRTADPQAGLQMTGLKPLVYEMLYNFGDNQAAGGTVGPSGPTSDGSKQSISLGAIRGNAKPLPMLNCAAYTGAGSSTPSPGFPTNDGTNSVKQAYQEVPWINCIVGAIIIPPSRLHELFYRMVIEWTIEFSDIRPVSEITDFVGLGVFGNITHYQNYSFESTKKALGVETEIMDNSQAMVDANVPIDKVM